MSVGGEIMDRYATRLAAVAEAAERAGASALVIAPSPDLVYLTGYEPMPLERPTLLVIRSGQRPTLIVPRLERPLAAAAGASELLDLVSWRDGDDPYALAAGRLPAGTIAVGDRIWGVHVLGLQAASPGRRWVPGSPIVGALRVRKDPYELDALRQAAHAADRALERVLGEPLIGRTERGVASTLADALVTEGHARADFTIVASGPNAASPHHEPGERTLAAGDALVLDFGGVLDGYCSDTTRTVALGASSERLRTIHGVVLEAHRAAIAAVRPGAPIRSVDAAARSVIEDAGYGERFLHRTGHGIGLDVHEAPYVSSDDPTVLEPGMTFSIEPGVYLDGELGVRIEDIVAVTDDGCERLNGSPRRLRVVG